MKAEIKIYRQLMTNNSRGGSRDGRHVQRVNMSFAKVSSLLLVALLSIASLDSGYSPITFVACVNVEQKLKA